MHRTTSTKNSASSALAATGYMSIQKKAPLTEEAAYKKPRRWGCCRISIALISLVFLVAFILTLVCVFLFTDLSHHLRGDSSSNDTSQYSLHGSVLGHVNDTAYVLTTTTAAPFVQPLKILVFVVDIRTHFMDGGAFKATLEAWKKTEAAWKDMYNSQTIQDQLSVMTCQGCKAAGVKEDGISSTIFYTIEHFRGDSHSFNTVVYVGLPTPPGEILTMLKQHALKDRLGEVCQKGTWSATGCDFKVANPTDAPDKQNFILRVPPSTEIDLLKHNKTIIMQRDIDTFKVLINQPMAVR